MGIQQRRQAKKKDREREKAADKNRGELLERVRRRRDQYPKVLIDPTNGDPEFVELVRKANSEIDFDDRSQFDPIHQEFFRQIKRKGYRCTRMDIREYEQQLRAEGDDSWKLIEPAFVNAYGTILFERIPEKDRRQFIPYNDVNVSYHGRDLVLEFTSLLAQGGINGTVYYSRFKPTIEFGGKTWTVAFSRHSIERICERINPRFMRYDAAGDVHAYFYNCVYFEPVMLYNDQPAFSLFGRCGDERFIHYDTYVRKVLGEENVDRTKGELYHRLGYCPIAFEGEFAKAKTFLYPGYSATPEFSLILKSDLGRDERELLIKCAKSQDAEEVVINDNPETIKWFHDHGVPQVFHMKHDVFVY